MRYLSHCFVEGLDLILACRSGAGSLLLEFSPPAHAGQVKKDQGDVNPCFRRAVTPILSFWLGLWLDF